MEVSPLFFFTYFEERPFFHFTAGVFSSLSSLRFQFSLYLNERPHDSAFSLHFPQRFYLPLFFFKDSTCSGFFLAHKSAVQAMSQRLPPPDDGRRLLHLALI